MRDREEDPRVFFFRLTMIVDIAKQNSPLLLSRFFSALSNIPPRPVSRLQIVAPREGEVESENIKRERESPLVSPSSREGTNALLRDDSLSRLLTLLSRLCVSARDFPLLSKGTLPIYREQPREARGGEKEGRAKERGARSRLGRFFETKSKAKERVNAGVGRKKRRKQKTRPRPLILSLSVLPASIDRKRSP